MDTTIQIMGIVNVTPDSFFDGGQYYSHQDALRHAEKLVADGADILDIGGESTRPGARQVEVQEEIDRVCPVIEGARKLGVPVSVDTTKSAVAEAAVQAGAAIINDISGLSFDPKIADVAARYQTGLVLMHIQGTPQSMQDNPRYRNLLEEVYDFLKKAADTARAKGVSRDKIIVDPGIGFGKSLEDNYVIINNVTYFKKLGYPVLIGLSRKSLIGKIYNDEKSDRLPATIALNTISIVNGANIIRVHDVLEHKLALQSIKMLRDVS